jgi:beta-lactam-binding protein with PASTA domain
MKMERCARRALANSSFLLQNSYATVMTLRAQIRKLFRLFLLFTVLVTVALVSAVTTIRFTIHGHQETMPKFVGMTLEAAQRGAGNLGLTMKVEDKVYSTLQPANQIVSQEPPAGTRIKAGQHVHVLVSLGPPRVAVPNLVGSSLRAAQITAVQRGLSVANVAALPWAGTEADQVVAQDPPPSAATVHSPAISLLVSLSEEPPAYLCPDLTGQPLAAVRRQVEAAGMKVGQVTSFPAQNAPTGTILSQAPAPGNKIGPGTVFAFQVAE